MLRAVSASGNRELVEWLLSNGLDANAKNDSGEMALHRATNFGFAGVVESLVSHGADVYATDNKGKTPLLLAMESGNGEIVNMLRRLEV